VTDTVNHYFQPVDWLPIAHVPVTYILNERDRPIPTAMQEEMIGRLPVPPDVIRLDTGHIPPVTQPEHFAKLLRTVSEG
jgi:pimeloyl-ACP methyl ester carboxylesterase